MSTAEPPGRVPRWRLVLFASGDFAFNLYWQSAMLFLLFYYTDVLRLPLIWGAGSFALVLAWDGLVSAVVGLAIDARRFDHRRLLAIGAVPLGLSFVLAYLPLSASGGVTAGAIVFATHFLFRTAYALVNLPYLALSARVSGDSGDRALIAGLRMLFGTAALLAVTLGTAPIGRWLGAVPASSGTYFRASMVFAAIATAQLLLVAAFVPTAKGDVQRDAPVRWTQIVRLLAGNRAFVTLNLAAMAMVVASTVLTKSVLYDYKYALGDEAAGQVALAAMGVAGAAAVPVWTLFCRRLGARATWLWASGIALGLLAAFAGPWAQGIRATDLFLAAMQVMLMGLSIAFWAMLPDTVEYGERGGGPRLEGAVFGVAALLQRAAIGLGTALFGAVLGGIGYRPEVVQTPATLAGLRATMTLLPMLFLTLSVIGMALSPLTRRAHARIMEDLAAGRRGD